MENNLSWLCVKHLKDDWQNRWVWYSS